MPLGFGNRLFGLCDGGSVVFDHLDGGFLKQVLDFPTVLDGSLDVVCQCLRYVEGTPASRAHHR